jgi:hypothetical protein
MAEVIAFPRQPARAEPAPSASTRGGIVLQLESFDPSDFEDNLRNGQLARFEDYS